MPVSAEIIINQVKETRVVPLFTHERAEDAFEVISAAYRAGVRVFEVTNRKQNSLEVFSALVKRQHELPGLMLGIGTIMDGDTTQRFIDAGAQFIISPVMNTEMAAVCRSNTIAWIPGCATLTEIMTARQHGAELIKIFPGSVLGPGFVSAVLSVVPDLQLMITGGVEPTQQNLSAWFKAGASCVGLGSHLFSKDMLTAKDWDGIERSMRSVLEIARSVR
jgi:2-dehydro-3-deoxyphosphogluconate aldolase / (4S)-4-hydroxy-2-oxoglutarate aldolase